MTPAKGENDLECDISSHVENTLPLPGDGEGIPILGIEVLREVEVVGIGGIGEVGAVDIKGRDCLPVPVDEIGSKARIEQGIGGGWDLGIQGAVDLVLRQIGGHPNFKISLLEGGAGFVVQSEFDLGVQMGRLCPGDMICRVCGMGEVSNEIREPVVDLQPFYRCGVDIQIT